MVERWLQWSGMKAKVCKCHSLALQGSTGKLLDPQLAIGGETIPFIRNDSIKFLGMRIQMPHNVTANKELLTANMNRMLIAVDQCPLTCHQKLQSWYLPTIVPRLSWLLLIEELPISWVEREAGGYSSTFFEEMGRSVKVCKYSILYLPTRLGGLNLPTLTSI